MIPVFKEVHIENTNSCRYHCTMCPREKQTRSLGLMSLEDFNLILKKIASFEGDFHLHGFGEPLLDRGLAAKIFALKNTHPKSSSTIFTTLGVRLDPSVFDQIVQAGLSSLVISIYGFNQEEYKKVHGFDGFSLIKKNLEFLSLAKNRVPNSLKVYVKIPSENVSSTLLLAQSKQKADFCNWIENLGFEIRRWSYVHNYSIGRSYNLPSSKLCPVVEGQRKQILNITWDLDVIPCCYDFNATISFGNLRSQTLEEIFTSPQYLSFLIAHKTNTLSDYKVCQNCEKNDYL